MKRCLSAFLLLSSTSLCSLFLELRDPCRFDNIFGKRLFVEDDFKQQFPLRIDPSLMIGAILKEFEDEDAREVNEEHISDADPKEHISDEAEEKDIATDIHQEVMVEVGQSCGDGNVCGAYVAVSPDGRRWIFKPTTEEGHNDGQPLKRGIPYGETTLKEQAAYLIGERYGVPETLTAKAKMAQGLVQGSIQRFVEHKCTAEEMGSSSFSAEDVHSMAILDVRLLNLDRHLGNFLVTEQAREDGTVVNKLVPIDHGYCLPTYKDLSDVYFGWQFWPQAKLPPSETTKADIANIDVIADAIKLQKLGIQHESIIGNVFSTLLLQKTVAEGGTLFDVAKLVTRDAAEDDVPSALERALSSLSLADVSSEVFPWTCSAPLVERFFAAIQASS